MKNQRRHERDGMEIHGRHTGDGIWKLMDCVQEMVGKLLQSWRTCEKSVWENAIGYGIMDEFVVAEGRAREGIEKDQDVLQAGVRSETWGFS
ncbi:hypothetical protein JTE90_015403 [Oedothorax gibbosus]|uniref:Uncharacterized protein n=1 Tax=Oedothorax gibbosus TaxID=931172 RepID=A0AAV6U715_9ARAC|nr:hypothetical protein JTE90_015403 [Oedothorax gibbosus]